MEVPIKAYIRIAPRFLKKYLCKNLFIRKLYIESNYILMYLIIMSFQ